MKKRVILSAGGTGGHLFPAQSLARALPDWEILFAGGGLGNNPYFDKTDFSYAEFKCATFSFSKPLALLKGCFKICKGVYQSRKIIRGFAPDLVIGFGSFYTLPMLIAAVLEKVPIILHEQNAVPGKVNRLFARFAEINTITFPVTREFLKGRKNKNVVEVSFPMTLKEPVGMTEAWRYFNLNPMMPTLLVFGGSQGAARLNALFLEALTLLPSVQIVHFTGNEKRAQEARECYSENGINACVKSFESRIDLAMQIADCAITRAGAATIAELIEYELPALLIPYPYATENHQEKNAEHFVSIVKGGKMYKEGELNPALLAEAIRDLIDGRGSMRANIVQFKKERHPFQLADLVRRF